MIASSDARRTVASTCAEGMIATSIATDSHRRRGGRLERVGRRSTGREVRRATVARSVACPRALQRSPIAADPLGKLQRGLGSGYLWALDADRAVSHALLVHCVFNDPRWDRQLDDRDDYHATLALDIGLDLAPLEGWLRDSPRGGLARPRTTSSRCSAGWRSAAMPRRAACCASTSATAPRGRARSRGSSAATTAPRQRAAVARGRRGARRGPARALRRRRTRSTRRSPGSTRASARGRCGPSRTRRSRARWRSTTAIRVAAAAARVAPARAPGQAARDVHGRAARDPRVLALGADRRGARDAHDPVRRRAARRRRERAGPADAPRGDPRAGPPGPPRGARRSPSRTRIRPSAASSRARSRWRSRRCRCRRRARWRTTGSAPTTGRGGARRPACSRRGPRTRTSAPARAALTRELDRGLDGDVYVVCSLAEALGPLRRPRPVRGALARVRGDPVLLRPPLRRHRAGRGRPDVRRRRRGRVPVRLRARDPPARRRARRPPRPARPPSASPSSPPTTAQAASVRRARRGAPRAQAARDRVSRFAQRRPTS